MKENVKLAIFTVLSIVFFTILNFLVNHGNISLNVDITKLFLVICILFAITFTFLYKKIFSKYKNIVDLNIKEATLLMQFYRVFSNLEYKVRVNAKVLVDNYIIKILTFKSNNLDDFLYEETEGFYDFLYKVRPKNNTELKYMDNGLRITRDIENLKNQYIFLNNNKMNSFEKIIFYTTGILLVITLNLLPGMALHTLLLKVLLSTTVVYFLWYLFALDYLKINSNSIRYEIYEKVLDQMGVIRYYPEHFESDYNIPSNIKEFRLGSLDLETKEISIRVIKIEDQEELLNE